MSPRLLGLITFVAVVALNAIGLWMDAELGRRGLTTVTNLVRARPLLGAPIIALQIMGSVGLILHFYYPK